MPKLINLIGQQFGNLLVIDKAESRSGKTYWKCQCQKCKQLKEVQGTHLKNDTFKDCCKDNILNKEERKCIICGQNFIIKDYGYTRKYCYECSPSYIEDRGATITAIRHAIKKQLVKYKGGKCEKCGYDKCIAALQFHHINPEEKDFELSIKYNNGQNNLDSLYKEADKCQLLCANCHAEEHYK